MRILYGVALSGNMNQFEHIVAWLPHIGLYLPNVDNRPEFDTLRRDSLTLADEQVDRLYSFLPNKITSDYSRFMVDLERYLDNSKEPMATRGMGYLYNRLIDGTLFDRVVFGDDKYFTLYYKHKHAQLKQAIEHIGNGAILLDLHSFNPVPLACDMDKRPNRPDICLGFNEDETKPDESILQELQEHFEDNGLKVAFNTPFSGAMTTNTQTKYKSLMIEVNKKCYLENHVPTKNMYRLSYVLKEAILLLRPQPKKRAFEWM